MTNDIVALIEYYEKEKGIDRDKVVAALEFAFISAYRKMVPGADAIETLRADEHVWVYRRTTPDHEVIVALNAGSAVADVQIPGTYRDARDVLDANAAVTARAGLAFSVPAGGYRIVAAR